MNNPDYAYEKKLNRVWLCSLVNFLVQKDFAAFIAEKIEEAKQSLIKSQNLYVNLNP